jgi:glycosyltransferase involved in cell wall biosynthesis
VLEHVSDDNLRWLYSNATALIAIAHEDFGLTPIEGFAFGLPCIALRSGGYLDSCREGITGPFIEEASVDAVHRAVEAFSSARYSGEQIRAHGERFSETAFLAHLHGELAKERNE